MEVTYGGQTGQQGLKPETGRLLTAANYFLQQRNFAECCKYAARAVASDPTHPAPTRILSIAVVLSVSRISSSHHDYYAVLNLPCFDSDPARIGSSYKTLASILDPILNPFPLSSEAFGLVMKAWSVLSNPVEKAKFDDELRRKMTGGCTSGSGGSTFWTMCPYCYYVYEYETIFEDCCLKCANERCRGVLRAVAIRAPPPPDVVEKGQYWCPGFMPLLAIRNGNGEGIGENLWVPFAPATESGIKGCDIDVNVASDGDYMEISDDETEKAKEFHSQGVNDESGGKAVENGVKEVRMKRKKSVPWNSKKLLGRGVEFEIDINQGHLIYGAGEEGCLKEAEGFTSWCGVEFGEEVCSNVDKNETDAFKSGCGEEFVEGDNAFKSGGGVEFVEGDDDVFISFSSDFDLENGVV